MEKNENEREKEEEEEEEAEEAVFFFSIQSALGDKTHTATKPKHQQ